MGNDINTDEARAIIGRIADSIIAGITERAADDRPLADGINTSEADYLLMFDADYLLTLDITEFDS